MRIAWIVPAGLIGGALYLWHVAGHFRGGVGRYEVLGPAFFPKLLLAALIVVCLLQLAGELIRALRARQEVAASGVATIHWGDLALALGITVAYAASLKTLGFLVATPLFQVLLLAAVFRVTDWRLLVGVPAALVTLFTLIFVVAMNVPLPRGRWLFAELSRLVY